MRRTWLRWAGVCGLSLGGAGLWTCLPTGWAGASAEAQTEAAPAARTAPAVAAPTAGTPSAASPFQARFRSSTAPAGSGAPSTRAAAPAANDANAYGGGTAAPSAVRTPTTANPTTPSPTAADSAYRPQSEGYPSREPAAGPTPASRPANALERELSPFPTAGTEPIPAGGSAAGNSAAGNSAAGGNPGFRPGSTNAATNPYAEGNLYSNPARGEARTPTPAAGDPFPTAGSANSATPAPGRNPYATDPYAAPVAPTTPAPNRDAARGVNDSNYSSDPYAAPSRGAGYPTASDPRELPQRDPPQLDFAARESVGDGRPAGVGGDGSGLPGAMQLEGPQTPSLSLHKAAPKEMKVGQTAVIEMVLRNVGSTPAHNVVVRDEVPKGVRFVDATPTPTIDARGELTWNLNTMQPGDEIKVQMRVVPQSEGEVGSVAKLTFTADASARSIVTRPQLVVAVQGGGRAMIHEDVALKIRVSNPGTGSAENVVLRDTIPDGLEHPAGGELEYEIGTLAPGESRDIELSLRAAKAGRLMNQLDAYAEGNLRSRPVQTEITVVAPGLEVATNGPNKRYLERPATYTVSVSNPGTAPAKQIALTAYLPDGFEFVKADNAGRYDPTNRTVLWLLEELPPERTGSVSLTTLPIEAGVKQLRFAAEAQQGLTARDEQEVLVEGVAAVLFQVADLSDPIEVGGETTYEIKVVNQGSKTSNNVRLAAFLPEQMQVLDVEGPVRYTSSGGRVTFEPIPRLAPKADTMFRVKVKGNAAGDVRFRVQVITDEMSSPVTKEESTRIFGDE